MIESKECPRVERQLPHHRHALGGRAGNDLVLVAQLGTSPFLRRPG
jgi:hypothetical protein